MKILVLAESLPDNADQGDRVRLLHFVRWFSQRHEVHIACFGGSENNPATSIAVPPPSMAGKVARALFSPHLPASVASRRSGKMEKALAEVGAKEKYDLFFIYQTKMASYLPALPCPVVVDLTDAVSLYYGRMTEYIKFPLRQLYRFEQFKMANYERRLLKSGTLCIVASESDARYLRKLAPGARIEVVPNGVDAEYFTPAPERGESFDLVFIGNMAYPPNRDGVLFFYRQVFPLVKKRCSKARLVVVGKNPPDDILALDSDPSVEITGYVSDIRPFLAGAAVVISPVRFGAGTRIKILEAMAAGRAVVSTTLGCEGLEVTKGEDIMIADIPGEMADLIVNLLEDREKTSRIGRRAVETVRDKYDRNVIGKKLEVFLNSLI